MGLLMCQNEDSTVSSGNGVANGHFGDGLSVIVVVKASVVGDESVRRKEQLFLFCCYCCCCCCCCSCCCCCCCSCSFSSCLINSKKKVTGTTIFCGVNTVRSTNAYCGSCHVAARIFRKLLATLLQKVLPRLVLGCPRRLGSKVRISGL